LLTFRVQQSQLMVGCTRNFLEGMSQLGVSLVTSWLGLRILPATLKCFDLLEYRLIFGRSIEISLTEY